MKIAGHTTVTDYRTGEVLYDHHNVITNQGLTRVAELLGGLNVNFINKMAIGDEGAPGGSPSTPEIPLATDTNLDHRVAQTTILNPVIIGTNQLRFTALFLTSPPVTFSGALHAVNEVGLFLQDDNTTIPPGGGQVSRMFARNTFPSIPFDPTDREGLIVTWTLTIV